MQKNPTAELKRVRQWAQEKIDAGSEPPWAWFQYMKLIETVDAILQGADATTTTENSQQSDTQTGKRLRLVEAKCPKIALNTVAVLRRYRCPCNTQRPELPVIKNADILTVFAQPIFDIPLANSHHSTRITFMPDDVNALGGHII